MLIVDSYHALKYQVTSVTFTFGDSDAANIITRMLEKYIKYMYFFTFYLIYNLFVFYIFHRKRVNK